MAELQSKILEKLEEMMLALRDIRLGMSLALEENLQGLAQEAEEGEDN